MRIKMCYLFCGRRALSILTRRKFQLVIIFVYVISVVLMKRHLPLPALDIHDKRRPLTRVEDHASPTFSETLRLIPWKRLREGYQGNGTTTEVTSYAPYGEQLLNALLPFIILPPSFPVNRSCLPSSPDIAQFAASALPCIHLRKERKIALLLNPGTDADTLEILLHEIFAVVHRVFLVETKRTLYSRVLKPLLWERLQYQNRFQPFRSKVVYFVMDDGDMENAYFNNDLWISPSQLQLKTEIFLWERFSRWNAARDNVFGPEDVVGFSDMGEIPSRDNLYYLKYCELPSDPVDVGLWSPMGNINQAFLTDCPVMKGADDPGLLYTFGAPTLWTLKSLQDEIRRRTTWNGFAFRKRGTSENALLGGVLLTNYNYIPHRLSQLIIETGGDKQQKLAEKLTMVELFINRTDHDDKISKHDNLLIVQQILAKLSPDKTRRLISLKDFQEMYPDTFRNVVKLPWFYECNRKRYVSWEGKLDARLEGNG